MFAPNKSNHLPTFQRVNGLRKIKFEQDKEKLSPVSVTRKKLPNVYKNCPKMISQEKWSIFTPSEKLPKNVEDLGKLIVAKSFKK